ncbi:MAG: GntR family transcriptional regulator [Thermodesulfobacteriota bacterium]|nr:GntR family transcriptional regulator [Thermodesulfobacteriota bacterium]
MKQRFKYVANQLMREIFHSKIKPGEKLPTERELAREMEVDRTSLRIALKQLESMDILDIRQGDGIYVKDYMKNAGVDFLRLLFLQQEAAQDEIVVDEYIIDEVLAFWVEFMPLMVKFAARRITARDIKQFIDVLTEELENIDEKDKVIASELLQQEMIAEKTDNLLFLLLSNSTRPLRKKLVTLFVEQIDDKGLREHIEFKRALFRSRLLEKPESIELVAEGYKKTLASYQEIIRRSWKISARDEKIVSTLLGAVNE